MFNFQIIIWLMKNFTVSKTNNMMMFDWLNLGVLIIIDDIFLHNLSKHSEKAVKIKPNV